MQLYHRVQVTVYFVRKAELEVVRYSGSAIALHIWRLQLVHIEHCLLLSIGTLLGVSINRESTV